MKKLKLILIISLTLNLILISTASIIIYKKGGMGFIETQVKAIASTQQFTDFYLQRKNIFESSDTINVDKVFVGDSLTEHGEFQEYFQNEFVLNRGISSDSSKGVLNRINEVVKRNPKEVYLMIGVNDVGTSDEEYRKNILEIIGSFDKQTDIYIQSILPLNENVYIGAASNERNKHLNNILKDIADSEGHKYIDLYPEFTDNNGQLKEEYSIDGIHLTGDGYRKWIQIISK